MRKSIYFYKTYLEWSFLARTYPENTTAYLQAMKYAYGALDKAQKHLESENSEYSITKEAYNAVRDYQRNDD